MIWNGLRKGLHTVTQLSQASEMNYYSNGLLTRPLLAVADLVALPSSSIQPRTPLIPCHSATINPWSSNRQLGNTDLPEQSPDLTKPDEIPLELIKTLHHVLLEVRS